MGYRKMQDNVWGKPFGYILLTFELDSNIWSCNFITIQDKPGIWDSKTYFSDVDDFKRFLQYNEAFHTKTYIGKSSDFSFLTQSEQIEW